jgi:threonine dehydrogenase-like Zn-dependent dehydrogenase
MAEFLTLPAANLHVVPDQLSDAEACFTEPLAAACRILEQGLVRNPAIKLKSHLISNSSSSSGQQNTAESHETTRTTAAAATTTAAAADVVGLEVGMETGDAARAETSLSPAQAVAVVGDGRLGLLVAQVLAVAAPDRVVLFGRHQEKMGLVTGLKGSVKVDDADEWQGEHKELYDLVVEASGEGEQALLAAAWS